MPWIHDEQNSIRNRWYFHSDTDARCSSLAIAHPRELRQETGISEDPCESSGSTNLWCSLVGWKVVDLFCPWTRLAARGAPYALHAVQFDS